MYDYPEYLQFLNSEKGAYVASLICGHAVAQNREIMQMIDVLKEQIKFFPDYKGIDITEFLQGTIHADKSLADAMRAVFSLPESTATPASAEQQNPAQGAAVPAQGPEAPGDAAEQAPIRAGCPNEEKDPECPCDSCGGCDGAECPQYGECDNSCRPQPSMTAHAYIRPVTANVHCCNIKFGPAGEVTEIEGFDASVPIGADLTFEVGGYPISVALYKGMVIKDCPATGACTEGAAPSSAPTTGDDETAYQ